MSFFSLLLLQPIIIIIMHKLFRAAKNNIILFAYYYYYEDVICLHWYNNLTIIFAPLNAQGSCLSNWYESAFWWWMQGIVSILNFGMHGIRGAISPGLFTISMVYSISTTARWGLSLDLHEARGARSAHAQYSCWCSWEAEASSLLGLVQQQGSVQPSSSIDGRSNVIPTSCLVRLRSCRIL